MNDYLLLARKRKSPTCEFKVSKCKKRRVSPKHVHEPSNPLVDPHFPVLPDPEHATHDCVDTPECFGGHNSFTVTENNNHIYFTGPVTQKSMDKLIEIINDKNEEFHDLKEHKLFGDVKPREVYLHITSFGGSLLAVFKAVDAIKRSTIPIHTIIDGYAASAGTILSVVGVKKYMTPNALTLIHQLSSGMCGKYSEIEDDYKNCKQWMDVLIDLYHENTNMTKKQIKECLQHDLWWRVDKCLETGLVDEVWTNDDTK
jgi:ATP-dependent protease ClpP protease subunit